MFFPRGTEIAKEEFDASENKHFERQNAYESGCQRRPDHRHGAYTSNTLDPLEFCKTWTVFRMISLHSLLCHSHEQMQLERLGKVKQACHFYSRMQKRPSLTCAPDSDRDDLIFLIRLTNACLSASISPYLGRN